MTLEVVNKDAEVSTYHMAKIFCRYLTLIMLIEYLEAHKARINVKGMEYLNDDVQVIYFVRENAYKQRNLNDDQNSVKQWNEKDLICFCRSNISQAILIE